MDLRQQFVIRGVAYPIECLTQQESLETRQLIEKIIDECEGSRFCILKHPEGKELARSILSQESLLETISEITTWDSVELCDMAISVRLPYSKRHAVWHRDGAVGKYNGSLVCVVVSLANTGRRDSGLFFLGDFSCLRDLRHLGMPYHVHEVMDDSNQPREIVRVPLLPGQALVFDCNVPHGNLMNYAPSARIALVGFYTIGQQEGE